MRKDGIYFASSVLCKNDVMSQNVQAVNKTQAFDHKRSLGVHLGTIKRGLLVWPKRGQVAGMKKTLIRSFHSHEDELAPVTGSTKSVHFCEEHGTSESLAFCLSCARPFQTPMVPEPCSHNFFWHIGHSVPLQQVTPIVFACLPLNIDLSISSKTGLTIIKARLSLLAQHGVDQMY